MRRVLIRTPVTHDDYLLSEIADPGLPECKMYVFLDGFRMSNELRPAVSTIQK